MVVVDWRRFPSARAFMGFTGLVPAGYSSGERTRRGSITKAGSAPARTALIEAAYAYRYQPRIGVAWRQLLSARWRPGSAKRCTVVFVRVCGFRL